MTTPTLDHLDADPSILARMERDLIDAAVQEVGAHGVKFSSADIRPIVKAHVNPHRIGNRLRVLADQGVIVRTGGWTESGNSEQRNATRPVRQYRLATTERSK